MSKRYVVESDFEHNGLRCVVTFCVSGHRCGYVGVPKSHILYGKDYMDYLDIKKEDCKELEVSGVLQLVGAVLDEDERINIETYFNCHGGITYSSNKENSDYPVESDLWWFGFDCAHYEDGKDLDLALKYFPDSAEQILLTKSVEMMYPVDEEVRSLEYVKESCKFLADQFVKFV